MALYKSVYYYYPYYYLYWIGEDGDDGGCCGRWQIAAVGGGADEQPPRVHPEMSRRAAHPHMNNLVYGRRSDPGLTAHLDDDKLGAAVCRQVINRCARWQRQTESESY